ncbi:MAG: hypothetical protein U0T81_14300 [Saprospiraceae bacterium]
MDSAVYNLQWKLENHIFSKKVNINPGSQYIRVPFRISNPKLWWPNGLGDPYLYKVRIQLSDSAYRPVSFQDMHSGIRRIDLINKSDKWGKGFYFKVNGHPVFAKGANYIPQDIFETDNFDHRSLLEDVYQCGFNIPKFGEEVVMNQMRFIRSVTALVSWYGRTLCLPAEWCLVIRNSVRM